MRNAIGLMEKIPNASPFSPTYEDKSLEECLARVSNSEAQESIIEGAREACRKKFGQQ